MYGTVTLVDNTILTIQSNAEFQSLNGSSSTIWSASIDGTSVSNSDIKKVVVGSSITSIPNYFLRSCSNLIELDLSGATSLTTIGDYFLSYCTALNAPINIPEGVTTIGYTPLNNLTAFSSSITIPESITSFGGNSLRNLDNFNGPLVMNTSNFDSDTSFQLTTQSSTTSAYINGVKIRGKYASEYVSALPDKSGPSTYRKLILDTSPIIYGSANNQSRAIKALYGGIPGQIITSVTGVIRGTGVGNVTAFDGDTFWEASKSIVNPAKTPSYITVNCGGYPIGSSCQIVLRYTDSTSKLFFDTGVPFSDLAAYGITGNPVSGGYDYVDLTPVMGPGLVSKEILKLYGPAEQLSFSYTNTSNISIDKDIFISKATAAGITDINGKISLFRSSGTPSLIRYLQIDPDTGSPVELASSYVNSATAVQLLSEWGVTTTAAYLDSVTTTNVYNILSTFSSSTILGTKLIYEKPTT